MKKLAYAAILATAVDFPVQAAGPSEVSAASAVVTASVVAGSFELIEKPCNLVVTAVENVAQGVKLTLKGTAQSVGAVLILPVKAAGAASYAVGQTVVVTTHAAGWLITQGGKVIGFVPNESGKALMGNSGNRPQKCDTCAP